MRSSPLAWTDLDVKQNNDILRQHNNIPERRSDFHIWLPTVRIKWLQKLGLPLRSRSRIREVRKRMHVAGCLLHGYSRRHSPAFLAKVAIGCTRKDKYETNPQSILIEGQKSLDHRSRLMK